jgi:hypothetical protein
MTNSLSLGLKLDANKTEKQTLGWTDLVQVKFRYLAFVKTATNFRFFDIDMSNGWGINKI